MPSSANQSTQTINRQGLPGRRISGGIREDGCFKDFNQSLVAVMPRNNLSKTALARPTLWFSLPVIEGERRIEFQLFNEADELIYGTLIDATDNQGISEFQLPPDAPALVVDKTYRWTFSLGCANKSQFIVQGWIQRDNIPRSIEQRLKEAALEDQAALYESAGFWHEQVTILANLRRNDSSNIEIQIAWAELLTTAGLASHVSGDITDEANAMHAITVSP